MGKMDREQLIRQLKEILPVMNKVDKCLDEIDGLDERMQTLNMRLKRPKGATFREMIIGWGLGAMCGTAVSQILVKILPQGIKGMLEGFLILAGMAAGVYLSRKLAKEKGIKENAELQSQIDKCQKRRKEAEQEWMNLLSPHWAKVKSIVPEAYAYPFFVQQAYDYLVNGRADSIKEAINLFEEEQHRRQMEKDMQDMSRHYQSEMARMQGMVAQLEQRVALAEHEARVARSAQYDR